MHHRPLFNKIGFTRFGLDLQKLWQFRFYCWIWSGDGPESPVQRTRNLRSRVFRCFMPKCGAPLLCARRYTGDGTESPVPPESPAQRTRNLQPCLLLRLSLRGAAESPACRSLLPLETGISGPLALSLVWCVSGASPEGGRSLAGISGPGRSLRCTYTGVSSLSGLQRLVFQGTYKRPPSSPNL